MLHISPTFQNHIRDGARRVSFQFTVTGTLKSGTIYITMNVDGIGATLNRHAEKASRIACKRAGADIAILHAIVNPVR